jgi:exopolysaccharide biosynthesis protein
MIKRRCFVFYYFLALFGLSYTYGKELPEGLAYSHFFLNGTISVHVLEVNPHLFDIVSARSCEGLETVAEIAKRNRAVAAVNGGFFQMTGEFADLPMGILKIEQAWHATPHKARGAIGWSKANEKVLFDQVLTKVLGFIDHDSFIIDGINRIPREDQIILYNNCFRQTVAHSALKGIIEENVICHVTDESVSVPKKGFILSIGRNKPFPLLQIKEKSSFHWQIEVISQSHPPYTHSEDWQHVSYIVGGTPILVRGGQVMTDFSVEQTIDSFLYHQHARTAIGLLPNGHWVFVVVDGTKSLLFGNTGITIPDLADLMHQIGCVEALNMDGGGSSTLILMDHLVNQPCGEDEKGQRKVSDAFLIIPKENSWIQ